MKSTAAEFCDWPPAPARAMLASVGDLLFEDRT